MVSSAYHSYDGFVDICAKIVDVSDSLRKQKNLSLQRSANYFPDAEDGTEEADTAVKDGN
jgi:hypothetical protein